MNRHFLTCAAVCMLAFGCHRSENSESEPVQNPVGQLSAEQVEILSMREDYKVSISDARRQALEASALFDADRTRASQRTVDNVHCLLGDNSTRSSDATAIPDTLFYVVNFSDEAGFSIVSADKRLDGVYAFVPEGKFRTDTIDNPGMAIYLGMLEDYSIAEIGRIAKTQDSLLALYPQLADDPYALQGDTRASSTYDVITPWSNTFFFGPFATPNWHQRHPYNKKCPSKNGEKCLAGCVAIATAQTVAHYNKPKTHNGHTYDWDNIWAYENDKSSLTTEQINKAEDDIATLVQRIGDLVNIKYGLDESSTSATAKIEKCFEQLGFSCGNYTDYDVIDIAKSLKDGYLVYADGFSQKKTALGITVGYEGGHGWTIDGYVKQLQIISTYYTDTNKLVSTKTNSRDFVHCNWGWDGDYNGFFKNQVFDTNNPNANYDDEIYEAETRGTSAYYRYKLKVIKYIRPKN